MKARFFYALLAMALCFQTAARADVRQYFAEKNLIRLQVVAASDSVEDQAAKIRVRDAVRLVAVPIAAGAQSPEEAFALLGDHVGELTRAARNLDPNARVELVRTRFPARIYGNVLVPPGRYRALRITLGEGEGRNWWCVIYPDLCATDQAMSEALRDGQEIRFYSSIISKLFGGDER